MESTSERAAVLLSGGFILINGVAAFPVCLLRAVWNNTLILEVIDPNMLEQVCRLQFAACCRCQESKCVKVLLGGSSSSRGSQSRWEIIPISPRPSWKSVIFSGSCDCCCCRRECPELCLNLQQAVDPDPDPDPLWFLFEVLCLFQILMFGCRGN